MLRTADLLRYIVTLGSLLAFAAHAQSRVAELEERDAQRWLRRIPVAAQTLDYSGTFVYQQEDKTRTSRITHVVNGENELEKLEVLDGRPREYVRQNEDIVYYAPDEKAMLAERRVAPEGFPAFVSTDPAELAPHYKLRFGNTGRVAGYECQVLVLEPRDNLRYGYRLWVEKATGLLLQVQTIAGKNIIEQIGFTQLALGNISAQLVRPSYANLQDWRKERSTLEHVEVPNLKIGFLPPGFRQVASVKRLLSQTAADAVGESATTARAREVVQLVFSDGLAAISVFLEPGTQSRTEGSIQQGAIHIIGKRLGDFWLTIVGEVPAVAIRQVANSVEFKSNK